jgi:hypothetical protein
LRRLEAWCYVRSIPVLTNIRRAWLAPLLAAGLLALPLVSAPAGAQGFAPSGGLPSPPTARHLPEACPYTAIHVDWPRDESSISREDREDFAWIARAYVAALPKLGFEVVDERSAAYWHALLRLRRSAQNPSVFLAAMSIVPRAQFESYAVADRSGRFEDPPLLSAVQFRSPEEEAPSEYAAVFDIGELSRHDVAGWADHAADYALSALEPRIERLCSGREEELQAEERRLEQLRQSLLDEIERVRRLRQKQDKHIELRTDETSTSSRN